LVFFAGLNPGVLQRLQPASLGAGAGTTDRAQAQELQAAIVEMDQRARQKIFFSAGAGWCWQGERGCR
jgi:hypothetical protein